LSRGKGVLKPGNWKLSFYILPLFFSQIHGVKIKLSFHFIQSEPNKTRGPQEPVITHLVFNLTSKVYRNNFKSWPVKDHFSSNF